MSLWQTYRSTRTKYRLPLNKHRRMCLQQWMIRRPKPLLDTTWVLIVCPAKMHRLIRPFPRQLRYWRCQIEAQSLCLSHKRWQYCASTNWKHPACSGRMDYHGLQSWWMYSCSKIVKIAQSRPKCRNKGAEVAHNDCSLSLWLRSKSIWTQKWWTIQAQRSQDGTYIHTRKTLIPIDRK